MQLKKISFSCMLCFFALSTYGQLKLIDGKNNLYDAISKAAYREIDTLSNLAQRGVFYVGFKIGVDGVYDLKGTDPAPSKLKEVVFKALSSIEGKLFSKKARGNNLYVLPIEYYFSYHGNKLAYVLSRIPDVDLLLQRKPDLDFNSLFNLPVNNSNALYGIKCVMLQPIKLRGKIE